MKKINAIKEPKSIFRRALIFALFLVVLLAGAQAQATIFTYSTRAAFDAAVQNVLVETWDEFPSGTTFANGSTVNGITYSVSTGQAVVTDEFVDTTDPNTLGRTPDAYFYPTDTITFTFQSLIYAFGIDINTFATADGAYQATTNLGDVALSVFDPFPGLDTGQFIGFISDSFFDSVTISCASGDSYNLDTMRYTPLPPSLLLLGSGLAGLGLLRLRKIFKA